MKKNIVWLLVSFCIVLISGEKTGGPYLIYLILGVVHGSANALVGFGAIGILAALLFKKFTSVQNLLLCLSATSLMVWSLLLFFKMDTKGYNAQTFELPECIATFIFFGLAALWTNYRCARLALKPKQQVTA